MITKPIKSSSNHPPALNTGMSLCQQISDACDTSSLSVSGFRVLCVICFALFMSLNAVSYVLITMASLPFVYETLPLPPGALGGKGSPLACRKW